MAEPARKTVPWLVEFERDPATALDELLRGIADIAPYERGEPIDLLLMLFGRPPADVHLRQTLDSTLSQWLSSRHTDGPEVRVNYGMNRYVDEVIQALIAAYRLPLPETAAMLRRDLQSFETWLHSLYSGPGRDPAGELWRVMALTQQDRSLIDDWYRLCEEAGRSLPDHWVDIGLLGLRNVPEPGTTVPSGTLDPEVLAGLFRWAAGLASKGPVSRRLFQRRLATLMVLYPRAPKRWHELVIPLIDGYPNAPIREWLEGTDLVLRKGTVKRSRLPALPPKRRLDALIPRLGKEPITQLLPEVWSLVRDYERYAEATGVTEFVVKTAVNFSGRLRHLAPREALRLARLAHRWAPSDPYCWNQWAEALAAIGELEKAEVIYWEAIRRFPQDEVSRDGLADLFAKSGRLEQAEQLYRETTKRFPEDHFARHALAGLLAKTGRIDEAEKLYRETSKSVPDDPMLRTGLALLFAKKGRLDKSEALLREIVEHYPPSAAPLSALANVIAKSGRQDEAESLYRKAMRTFPEDRIAPHALAFWLLRWDRITEAHDLYWHIRTLFPEDAYTRELAEQINRRQEGWQGEIEVPDFSTWLPENKVRPGSGARIRDTHTDEATVKEGERRQPHSVVSENDVPGGDRGANGDLSTVAERDSLAEAQTERGLEEAAVSKPHTAYFSPERTRGTDDLEIAPRLVRNAIVSRADFRLRSGENGVVRRQALAHVEHVLNADVEHVYPRLILGLHDADRRHELLKQAEAYPHAYPIRFIAAREAGVAEAWDRLLGDFGEHRSVTLLGRLVSGNGNASPGDAKRLAIWASAGNQTPGGFDAFVADRLRTWLGEAHGEVDDVELLSRLTQQRDDIEALLSDALRRSADATVSEPA